MKAYNIVSSLYFHFVIPVFSFCRNEKSLKSLKQRGSHQTQNVTKLSMNLSFMHGNKTMCPQQLLIPRKHQKFPVNPDLMGSIAVCTYHI